MKRKIILTLTTLLILFGLGLVAFAASSNSLGLLTGPIAFCGSMAFFAGMRILWYHTVEEE